MNNINFLKGSRSWWTHVNTRDEASHFTHDFFSSGDYHGGAVQAANRKVILDDTELCERLGIELLSEAYSTESALFPIAALDDPELKEIFDSLDKYPCLDDQVYSEIENGLEVECFDSFGRRDFQRHLRDKLDESMTDEIDELDTDQLESIYYTASRETNYNIFQVESGTSGYFDFDSFGGLYDKQIELLTKLVKNEIDLKNKCKDENGKLSAVLLRG